MTYNGPELALRRLCKRYGLRFYKSPTEKSLDNRGGFILVEIATKKVIAGNRFSLSLQDVARELQKLNVLGR